MMMRVYLGVGAAAGAAVVSALFLAFLPFLPWWCFLVVVESVLDPGVVLADGVLSWGLPPSVWAKLRALPSTRVHAIANSCFIHFSFKREVQVLLQETRAARNSCACRAYRPP
jgi:hypothetical protein